MTRPQIWMAWLLAPVVLAVGCLSVLFVGGMAFGAIMSRATPHCPIGHKLRDLAVCEVSDERGGVRLLQHAELDINRYYVEIQDARGSRYFAPLSGEQAIASQTLLVDASRAIVRVEGKLRTLEPIPDAAF